MENLELKQHKSSLYTLLQLRDVELSLVKVPPYASRMYSQRCYENLFTKIYLISKYSL